MCDVTAVFCMARFGEMAVFETGAMVGGKSHAVFSWLALTTLLFVLTCADTQYTGTLFC